MKRSRKPEASAHQEPREQASLDKRFFSFFISSFKFSQGSTELQRLFFEWAINTGQLSQSDIAAAANLHESVLRQAMSIPQPHIEVSIVEFARAAKNQMTTLASIEKDSTFSEQRSLGLILVNVLYRDYYFLTEKQRPNRSANARNNPRLYDTQADPRASHFRKFVFTPNRIKDPIFRILFSKLRKLFLRLYKEHDPDHPEMSNHTLFEYLPVVEQRWNVTHPKQTFFDPIAKKLK